MSHEKITDDNAWNLDILLNPLILDDLIKNKSKLKTTEDHKKIDIAIFAFDPSFRIDLEDYNFNIEMVKQGRTSTGLKTTELKIDCQEEYDRMQNDEDEYNLKAKESYKTYALWYLKHELSTEIRKIIVDGLIKFKNIEKTGLHSDVSDHLFEEKLLSLNTDNEMKIDDTNIKAGMDIFQDRIIKMIDVFSKDLNEKISNTEDESYIHFYKYYGALWD